MINEYDEIKNLLKKTRMLMEQNEPLNLAKSIENKISDDNIKKYGVKHLSQNSDMYLKNLAKGKKIKKYWF